MRFNYVHNGIYMIIEHSEKAVIKMTFSSRHRETKPCSYGKEIKEQLDMYFKGVLRDFNVKFEFKGTQFQQDVLRAMTKIQYGKTLSYKQLAQKAGYPNAYRAAASVCSHNDLVLVIPCHRVIASDGGPGGFGNDVGLKIRLLEHEKQYI